MRASYLFTSESVSEGHPDKVSDQVSDAVLDYIMKEDPLARVACETLVTTQRIVLAGEVRADVTLGDHAADIDRRDADRSPKDRPDVRSRSIADRPWIAARGER